MFGQSLQEVRVTLQVNSPCVEAVRFGYIKDPAAEQLDSDDDG